MQYVEAKFVKLPFFCTFLSLTGDIFFICSDQSIKSLYLAPSLELFWVKKEQSLKCQVTVLFLFCARLQPFLQVSIIIPRALDFDQQGSSLLSWLLKVNFHESQYLSCTLFLCNDVYTCISEGRYMGEYACSKYHDILTLFFLYSIIPSPFQYSSFPIVSRFRRSRCCFAIVDSMLRLQHLCRSIPSVATVIVLMGVIVILFHS